MSFTSTLSNFHISSILQKTPQRLLHQAFRDGLPAGMPRKKSTDAMRLIFGRPF
jgi:hypothetical protein